jgi:hypothetical protein
MAKADMRTGRMPVQQHKPKRHRKKKKNQNHQGGKEKKCYHGIATAAPK